MPEYLVDAAPEPTPLPAYDPASGYHLDDAEGGSAVRRPDRAAPRERRFLALMLKSTPSGAIAAVDGKVLGRTPLFWEGEFTGREREFTFVLPGYSMARYRFVPVRDGFVHGRLEKVASDPGDAGVPAIPRPEPQPQPQAQPRPRPLPPPPPIDAAPPIAPPLVHPERDGGAVESKGQDAGL